MKKTGALLHPIIGERLCGELRSLEDVRPIIRHHHERRDGSGSPDGLAEDAIPLRAQIMGRTGELEAIAKSVDRLDFRSEII